MIQSTFSDIPPREFFPTPGRVFTEDEIVSSGSLPVVSDEVTFDGGTPAAVNVVFVIDWFAI